MPTDPLHVRDWEEMAAIDPLWAIMSAPEKRSGSWDINEFLRSRQEEISELIKGGGEFDFAFAKSVFTHMTPPAVQQYLRETARVVKPGDGGSYVIPYQSGINGADTGGKEFAGAVSGGDALGS
jgi:ubiquinone/menaquinone biosynthesis C-methylase UbiE